MLLPLLTASPLKSSLTPNRKRQRKYADIFWFSLFHEITHIIYGHIGQANGTSDNDEKEADSFARETLLRYQDLVDKIEIIAYHQRTLN